MELVTGETLADRIARGAIPLEESLKFAAQIAEALQAAHDSNVIHRDLKPANIKITPNGQVKVLDFGLAKAYEADVSKSNLMNSPTITSPATSPGVILGTAAYMSPEQAKGIAVDRRTDIFAFGLLLYEMLTGHRMFYGDTMAEVLAGVLKTEPDWSRLPPQTPASIRKLLRRCLQKDRNRRMDSAWDIHIEIEETFLPDSDVPVSAAVPRQPPRSRTPWVIAAASIIVAVAALALPYLKTRPEALEMLVNLATPASTDPTSLALSPDGRTFAFVASGDGDPRLWLRPLNSETAQPLPGTEGAVWPFWSPDSKKIGFFSGSQLKTIEVGGGKPKTISFIGAAARGGAWGSNGNILIGGGTSSIRRIKESGGEAVAVTELEINQSSHRFPHFLPDGRRYLFFATGPPEAQGIYLAALDAPATEKPKLLTASDAGAVYVAPDWLLFLRQGSLLAQRFDPESGAVTGDVKTVAQSVTYDATTFVGALSVSHDGKIVYRPGGAGKRQLTWFDRKGNPLGTLGSIDDSIAAPQLSPDSRRVTAFRTTAGNTDIWILDDIRTTQFTFNPGPDRFPIWSKPDGTHIIFDSQREKGRVLYRSQVHSPGTEMPLNSEGRDQAAWDYSPDGRFLLYAVSDAKTGRDVWVLPMTGNEKPYPLLRETYDERNAVFSPDGKWVAYTVNVSGQVNVEVRAFPDTGARWPVSTGGGVQPRWGPLGKEKEIYYIAEDSRLMAVPIVVKGNILEPGAPEPLFTTKIWGGPNCCTRQEYDVASDGRFLINVALDDAGEIPVILLLNWKP